jgi:hypothetical protein
MVLADSADGPSVLPAYTAVWCNDAARTSGAVVVADHGWRLGVRLTETAQCWHQIML